MNCTEVRHHLPGLLYGELKPEEAAAVEAHLHGCPACRDEYAALRQLPVVLDMVPAPAVRIDLPRLYQQAAQRQEHRLRRWRRAALASVAAAAAVLLLVGLLRLEVRLEAHQVVVRWGARPEVPLPAPAPAPAPPIDEPRASNPTAAVSEMQDRLRILMDLTQLLAADVETRDRRQQQAMVRLQARQLELEQQLVQWRLATEKDVAALYASQFIAPKKGTSP
jgi:hypothetical protein